jgi:hypothetical protein
MAGLLRRLFGTNQRPHTTPRSPARTRLGLDILEDRALMATALGPAVDVTGVSYGSQYAEGERTVARADNGNYAIVWTGNGPTGDGVYVRLFNGSGVALTGPKEIAGTSLDRDSQATVAMADNGRFIVAWTHDYTGDGSDHDVRGQLFDAAGNAVGGTRWLAASLEQETDPSVGMDANGNFVVGYTYTSGGNSDVRVRRFDAGGSLLQEIAVAASATRDESRPSVDVNRIGQFAVAYTYHYSATDRDVYAARYTSLGVLAGSTIIANSTLEEDDASVAIDGSGDFVVAYTLSQEQYPPPGSLFNIPTTVSSEVRAQRVNSSGVKQGGPISVGGSQSNFESAASVDVTRDGRFVIAFTYAYSTSDLDVRAQQFDASGNALGSAFIVSQSGSYDEYRPSVAVDDYGNFVVAFQTWGLKQDASSEFPDDFSVSARRFSW